MTPTENIVPFSICICGDPNCKIPFGHCHCKCGGKVNLAKANHTKSGAIRGMPVKYIYQHGTILRPELSDSEPFEVKGELCRLIPLTKGQHAIVWAFDYKWLMQWKWWAVWDKKGSRYYAKRHYDLHGVRHYVSMHRLILGLSDDDKRQGDHENRNTLDNRRTNLRPGTVIQNQQNSKKPITNTSGYKGVSWHKASRSWIAQICVNGKKVYLGRFPNPEVAHNAYCEAAKRYHGEFARFE